VWARSVRLSSAATTSSGRQWRSARWQTSQSWRESCSASGCLGYSCLAAAAAADDTKHVPSGLLSAADWQA
jgi:hypothetical protein